MKVKGLKVATSSLLHDDQLKLACKIDSMLGENVCESTL